jgi:hypothetical protein
MVAPNMVNFDVQLVRMHKQTLAQEQQKAVMAAAQPAPRRFKFRGLFSRLGGSRATE